jgi:DNA-binding HxlR family transcriptional regulator
MPATRKTYHHVCPAARALEVIGEKWSLLIVRDLLPGPQRFTDLSRTLAGITAKWLTLRLRDLELAGIVQRDREPGRREVWYKLTPKGRDLAPVVEALSVWGLEHAMRPPGPDEPVHPVQTTVGVCAFFNKRGVHLLHPVIWVLHLLPDRLYTVRFDGDRWSVERGSPPDDQADVHVETNPETWVAFLMAAPGERQPLIDAMQISGAPERVQEFTDGFGWRQHVARGMLRDEDRTATPA